MILLCCFVAGFGLPESISLVRTYKKLNKLQFFVSDLFSNPSHARLTEMMDFGAFSCDSVSKSNSSATLFEKLFRDNYHSTGYSVRVESTGVVQTQRVLQASMPQKLREVRS